MAGLNSISFNSGISYSSSMPGSLNYGQDVTCDKQTVSQEMRRLIRGLKQTAEHDQDSYAAAQENRLSSFQELSGSAESDGNEGSKKPVNYNYKEVASKIHQAKTSVSAARAVFSASRKVLEIKRKISAHDGDAKELQIALTHAKRMEIVARKKKHHLELEEMAEHTRRSDENRDRMEEAATDMKNSFVSAEEEKVTEEEDAIFDERGKMLSDAAEQDMVSEFNEMISEIGEDELKQLEEVMEMLENMEIIDPHMSDEDLDKLKRRHRTAENKAVLKADMDYLKDMIGRQTAPVSIDASIDVQV